MFLMNSLMILYKTTLVKYVYIYVCACAHARMYIFVYIKMNERKSLSSKSL